ncbi:MAG TPA: tRNA uridine-5-carboxymethylaminomethyl(34) synthesis GTPase MnmE [Candidatus Kapabacteria bacterium]|nr:tRNA uridine-5-carboxymethylaminomethyl(34) synthesis GTPase MnmE [Candidatus Kapabacteria bacterium]
MNRTIVALATPPGIGGLAVIRLSGKEAIALADMIFEGKIALNEAKSHTIHYGAIKKDGELIDMVTCSVFKEPNSYTGENIVEVSCHGGQIISNRIVELLINCGAYPATAGEFTRRAFLNGKLDLTQVEAVGDIIHSNTVPGVKTAARQLEGNFTQRLKNLRSELLTVAGLLELELDFSDEGIELIPKERIRSKIVDAMKFCNSLSDAFKSSEILRSGYFVGIVGFPNSGKSTLFNQLLSKNRAIVSHIPGTTRDYLEENIFIKDMAIRLIDTAGIREASDTIEIAGIKLVDSILEQSNLILILNDVSSGKDNSADLISKISKQYPGSEIIIVQNKVDIVETLYRNTNKEVFISAMNNIGVEELKSLIYASAKQSSERESDILINQRHAMLLVKAALSLEVALKSLDDNYENEFIAIDVRKSVKILGELTGETWNEEVLDHIFSKFCIGK